MWTKENRGRYDRSRLRYPSDLTVEQWGVVEPLIAPAKRGGNKRTVDVLQVQCTQFLRASTTGLPELSAP